MTDYTFDIEDATKYGVDEAILLKSIKFWIAKNEATGNHQHDGKAWTYNTVKGFSKLFPFWTEKQVRRILDSLINQGVLITGNFNKSAYDRTIWYALKNDEDALKFPNCPNGQMEMPEQANGNDQMGSSHLPKRANRFPEKGEPIPDSKPVNKPDSKKESTKEKTTPKSKKKFLVPDFVNPTAWMEFEKHRKEINKPLTDMARTKAANLLEGLTRKQQQEVIDYSIAGRYTGLFPDRIKNKGKNNGAHQNTSQHKTAHQQAVSDWLDEIEADYQNEHGHDQDGGHLWQRMDQPDQGQTLEGDYQRDLG